MSGRQAAAMWLLIGLAVGCGPKSLEVETAQIRLARLKSSFAADGLVKADCLVVSPRIAARVLSIHVREGDSVRPGQVLVELDLADQRAALVEASAAVKTGLGELDRVVKESVAASVDRSAAVRSATARLEAATATLRRAKRGALPGEIAAAEHRIDGLLAAQTEASQALARARTLYEEGVLPRAQFEQAVARERVASEQVDAARADLDALRSLPRSEDVAIAQGQADVARADLAAAKSRSVEAAVHAAAVRQARAQVQTARAAENRAAVSMGDGVLRSAVSGWVLRRHVEPGATLLPGSPALTIVSSGGVYVEAEAAEEDVAKFDPGTKLKVTSAGFPGTVFDGVVERVSPAAEPKADSGVRRQILRVRIRLLSGADRLRPGEEVDVAGDFEHPVERLVVPNDAVAFVGGLSVVWVVQEGKVHRVPVTLGGANFESTEVIGDLSNGDQVVVAGKEALAEGVAVRVKARAP